MKIYSVLVLFIFSAYSVEEECLQYRATDITYTRYHDNLKAPFKCYKDIPLLNVTDSTWQLSLTFPEYQKISEPGKRLVEYFQESSEENDSLNDLMVIVDIDSEANEIWDEMTSCIEEKYRNRITSKNIFNDIHNSWSTVNRITSERKLDFLIPEVTRRTIAKGSSFCKNSSQNREIWNRYNEFKIKVKNLIQTFNGERYLIPEEAGVEFHPLFVQEIFFHLYRNFKFSSDHWSEEDIKDTNDLLAVLQIEEINHFNGRWWEYYNSWNRQSLKDACDGETCVTSGQGDRPKIISMLNTLFFLETIPVSRCEAYGLWPFVNYAPLHSLGETRVVHIHLRKSYQALTSYFRYLQKRFENKCSDGNSKYNRRASELRSKIQSHFKIRD